VPSGLGIKASGTPSHNATPAPTREESFREEMICFFAFFALRPQRWGNKEKNGSRPGEHRADASNEDGLPVAEASVRADGRFGLTKKSRASITKK